MGSLIFGSPSNALLLGATAGGTAGLKNLLQRRLASEAMASNATQRLIGQVPPSGPALGGAPQALLQQIPPHVNWLQQSPQETQ